MNQTKWGITHCPVCEKPFARSSDYERYNPGEGDLCWDECAGRNLMERLIEVLNERDDELE